MNRLEMDQKIKLDDREYVIDSLNENAKEKVASLQFVSLRLQELSNLQAVLQRAKNSYVSGIKKEVLSNRSGLLIEDD